MLFSFNCQSLSAFLTVNCLFVAIFEQGCSDPQRNNLFPIWNFRESFQISSQRLMSYWSFLSENLIYFNLFQFITLDFFECTLVCRYFIYHIYTSLWWIGFDALSASRLYIFFMWFFIIFQAYIDFINKHDQTLLDLEYEINKSDKLRKACKEFEVKFNLFVFPVFKFERWGLICGR